jgi:guanylate kinase
MLIHLNLSDLSITSMNNLSKNNLIIISGPSGVGEDSIINGLKNIMPIERVITTSTREIRAWESQGDPYYFISKAEFKDGIKDNKFFEYAEEYNGNFYGVTFDEINRVKKSGKIGIWKIEYKGVISAKKMMPEIKAIFINAPLKDLEKRIRSREGDIAEEYIKERMEYTNEWLKHKDIYDYEIINEEGKLDEAIEKTANLIKKSIIFSK